MRWPRGTPQAPRLAHLECRCSLRVHGNGRTYRSLFCPDHRWQIVTGYSEVPDDAPFRRVKVGSHGD